MPEVSADFKTFTVRVSPGIYFADDPAFEGKKRELTAARLRLFDQAPLRPALARARTLPSSRTTASSASTSCARRRCASGKPFDYDAPVDGLHRPRSLHGAVPARRAAARASSTSSRDPPRTGAVAREVVERYGDTIMEHPVGTGPFRLAQWRRSSLIAFEKNPNYREEHYDEEPRRPTMPMAQAIARRSSRASACRSSIASRSRSSSSRNRAGSPS